MKNKRKKQIGEGDTMVRLMLFPTGIFLVFQGKTELHIALFGVYARMKVVFLFTHQKLKASAPSLFSSDKYFHLLRVF